MKYYAGIGSRKVPINVACVMAALAIDLANAGVTLRSGGADEAFETGCDYVDGEKEIYLPWKNFNNNTSTLFDVSDAALVLAEDVYNKTWNHMPLTTHKFMARNCYQVLGMDLNTPVDFIICWTHDGKASGGTGQAIRLANKQEIPVFNLYDSSVIYNVRQMIEFTY